jgi:hypothetical protein
LVSRFDRLGGTGKTGKAAELKTQLFVFVEAALVEAKKPTRTIVRILYRILPKKSTALSAFITSSKGDYT